MAIDSDGNLDSYQEKVIDKNINEKKKPMENNPEYIQLEKYFNKLCSESTNEILGHSAGALWDMFYPVHEYFFWKECINSVKENLTEKIKTWPEYSDFWSERARGDKKFCNKNIKSEKERENPLRNYHSKTIKEFIKNHNSEFYDYPLNMISDLPERKFVQYGCKPTNLLSFLI